MRIKKIKNIFEFILSNYQLAKYLVKQFRYENDLFRIKTQQTTHIMH